VACENGVVMITLPPYCTHRMQPLDRTFFKSLKLNYNAACDDWMRCRPGMRISFFEMAELFNRAYAKSAMHEKAVHGFESTGLWPYNSQVFSAEDFEASEIINEDIPADQVAFVCSAERCESGDPVTEPPDNDNATTLSSSENTEPLAAVDNPAMEVAANVIKCSAHRFEGDDPVAELQHGTSNRDGGRSVGRDTESGTAVVQLSSHEKNCTNSAASAETAQLHMVNITSKPCHPGLAEALEILQSLSPRPRILKPRTRKRKAESAAVVTVSPYKLALHEKHQHQLGSKPIDLCKKKKMKSSNKEKDRTKSQSTLSSDKTPCLYCREPYCYSVEGFVQCGSCSLWAHYSCAGYDSKADHSFISELCE